MSMRQRNKKYIGLNINISFRTSRIIDAVAKL